MAFIMQKITNDILNKILNDSNEFADEFAFLNIDQEIVRQSTVNIAIDSEKNYYLFMAPDNQVKRNSLEAHYYFYFKDNLYRVSVGENGINKINVDKLLILKNDHDFKVELKNALAVFGRFGEGQIDFMSNVVIDFDQE